MNPSYNNSSSFDSFGTQGSQTGQELTGAPASSMAPISQVPVSSGTGDIVLSAEPEKKGKKGLIVGVVVTAVIAILAIIIVTMLSFKKQTETTKANEETVSLVSSFASDVLYGDGREVDMSTIEYNSSQEYKLWHAVWFNEVDYLDKIIDEFAAIKETLLDTDAEYVEGYSGNLNFLRTYLGESARTAEVVINAYLNDANSALSSIEEHYKELMSSEIINTREYFTMKYETEKMYVELMKKMDAAGCVADGSISDSCDANTFSTEEENERMRTLQNDMKSIVESSTKYAVVGCWTIYDLLTNPVGEDIDEE